VQVEDINKVSLNCRCFLKEQSLVSMLTAGKYI